MIQLKNIHKSFGTLEVLKGVDLTIPERQITAIVGPSGAGKTTLLQIAGTLLRPDRGEVLYDGAEVSGLGDRRLSAFRNQEIGFVFQFHRLLPEFTALENVALPARIGGEKSAKANRRAMELLGRLGLADRASHKPAQLSGGECQRVAVARALINSPKVVLADEPTGSLDSRNRNEIQALFSRLCAELGQTFVIVTHDPSLASIAHTTVTLADGAVIGVESLNYDAPSGVVISEEADEVPEADSQQ